MKKIFTLLALVAITLNSQAQGGGNQDTTPTYPSGATYTLSDGSSVTKTNESLECSTQYYNVVQCTNGTLTLNNCTFTKSGDGSGGDNSSFYGNNSTIYAGAASSTNYQSTTAASGAKIIINGGTVTGNAKGANAVIATNGATIEINGITIVNKTSVSRGLHATYGGIITASDVNITTNEETSSTIATDRGGGTVTVTGGTATANGNRSAVIYSTGTMSATNLVGTSASGEMGVIEGDNSITMTNCTMKSGSSERGLLMMQSGSGDAQGSNPVMTITGTSLTMTDASAPLLEVATCVTATCTLSDCTLTVPSGILMYVMSDSQWSTSGAVGNLILDNGTYTGIVKYDDGYTANVTVNDDAVWNLTANTTISTLVNNGTINTNGYTLTYSSKSGSGTINTSAVTMTIGSMGWATYYGPAALDFSSVSGITAYTAAFSSEGTVTLTGVSQIPALTPVVISGTAGTYTVPITTSASAVSGNELSGSLTGVVAGSSNYALAKIDDTSVGFTLLTSGTGIPGGKAYYAASSSARTSYVISGTTAIQSVLQPAADAQQLYDLQGRKVSTPRKGIYVREGKKIIIK
ncbi:MAG: hypothetical protein K5764_02175 [Prevotella sp.]|nr:hypothetical protein [Prevotella sp.]